MAACRKSLPTWNMILSSDVLIKEKMMEESWVPASLGIHAQMFTEHLLLARHCSRHRRHSDEQDRPKHLFVGLMF